MPNSVDLTSYCGLYCGGCEVRQGKVKGHADGLRRFLEHHPIGAKDAQLTDEDQSISDFDQFASVLDSLAKQYGSCKGCKEGGGRKDCKVRSCASDRGYTTCVDCIRMENCELLGKNSRALPSLREIRDKGFDNWLKTKKEMVAAGWSFMEGED